MWHWAHRGSRFCDPWWENETEWHRSWKGQFPVNWQEVVHQAETGEKHIADVKTEVDGTLKAPDPQDDAPTQFGRAMGQLGVELILANSPQAKRSRISDCPATGGWSG